VPDRAGADTRVDVHIGLRDLRALDGAPAPGPASTAS